jgi:orotate phosphoribosyltransferase
LKLCIAVHFQERARPVTEQTLDTLAQEFVQFSLKAGALKFGSFQTKAGRTSPYFFNAGHFDDGAKLGRPVRAAHCRQRHPV